MTRKLQLVAVVLLMAAAASLARELVSRQGVGPLEYVAGILLVALLLRAALGTWRSTRHAAN